MQAPSPLGHARADGGMGDKVGVERLRTVVNQVEVAPQGALSVGHAQPIRGDGTDDLPRAIRGDGQPAVVPRTDKVGAVQAVAGHVLVRGALHQLLRQLKVGHAIWQMGRQAPCGSGGRGRASGLIASTARHGCGLRLRRRRGRRDTRRGGVPRLRRRARLHGDRVLHWPPA
jgi:hypothetical protein